MTGPNPRPGQARGKSKKGTTVKGGKREGAERKPGDLDNYALTDLMHSIRDREELDGVKASDKFADLIFSDDEMTRLRAFKIYYGLFGKGVVPETPKESGVMLPEKKAIGEKITLVK